MMKQLSYALVGMVAGICGAQARCTAQDAFFYFLRTDSNPDAVYVTIDIYAYASDSSVSLMPVVGTYDHTTDDENYAEDPEAVSADIGGASAFCKAIPVAEIIPDAGDSDQTPEVTTSLDGLWDSEELNDTSTAETINKQGAYGTASFEVQENPTYPDVTSGTLQIQLVINATDAAWNDTCAAYAENYKSDTEQSWIMVDFVANTTTGYLEGYGTIDYDYAATGTFTATRSISVGDTFTVSASSLGYTYALSDSVPAAGIAATSSFIGTSP